jgi:hypothetical protein
MARIAHHGGDHERGQRCQTSAFVTNRNLTPPLSRPPYIFITAPSSQARAIVARLLGYGRRRAILADFDEAVSGLVPEASSDRFEQSLADLGRYLGIQAQRPENEFRIGPDVLWITPGPRDFVIEAKSRKDADNPLYKRDHAQLLEAEQWFKSAYPGRSAVRISALREAVADRKATPTGTMALTLDALSRVSSALRRILETLASEDGDGAALERRCETLLGAAGLTPSAIEKTFLVPFVTSDHKQTE